MAAIVWFRRDLRVRDQPALRAALDRHDRVVPVFCLDDRLLHGRHRSPARTQFLLESLRDLDASLRERGGRLVVRHGPPERELPRLAEETGAAEVHVSADPGPFGRARDGRVRQAGLELHEHPGIAAVEELPAPYRVFSPFFRRWREQPRRDVLQAPRTVELPPLRATGRIPSLEALGMRQEAADPMRGGETEARARLERFLRSGESGYASGRDDLAADATSRLSPYLHLGCVSPRQLEERVSSAALRRQLAWRDFYLQVLAENPSNAHQELQQRYRGTLGWNDDDEAFDAWRQGRTGFPLVDAGMRQLLHEGWMHNRARLVAASFLVKDLGIDWRRGERWFMRRLIDGDEANNNGNWQWIASVGTDPAPWWRRHYSPERHRERHDPDETYVRRWLPELGSGDYPEPIVDRRATRRQAQERYGAARESVGTQ